MAIEIKPALFVDKQRVKTQINFSFLNYDVCYRVDEVQEGLMLSQSWHRHNTDQFLIPLRGQFSLNLQFTSEVTSMELVPGKKYRIPAGLTHYLITSGGLLESFLLGAGLPKSHAYLNEEVWTETRNQRVPSSQGVVAVAVEQTSCTAMSGCNGRVEIYTQVPGTWLGRKVYFAPLASNWKLLNCPHRHKTGHVLVCIAGKGWLAYRELDVPVRKQEMVPGYIYVVPSRLPHQMYIERGGIVASYFPPATWLSREEELEELNEDWF